MDSAYYCDLIRCWNKDYFQKFAVCRKATSCFSRMEHRHTVHTTLLFTSTPICLCSLNQKLASSSLGLTPVDYSVWKALQQMVYRHKISDIDLSLIHI